eukprot:235582-Pleurochrysis_carterae.AAC.3
MAGSRAGWAAAVLRAVLGMESGRALPEGAGGLPHAALGPRGECRSERSEQTVRKQRESSRKQHTKSDDWWGSDAHGLERLLRSSLMSLNLGRASQAS